MSARAEAAGSRAPLRIALFAPQRACCGVSDYTDSLCAALQMLSETAALRVVAAPEDAVRPSAAAALRGLWADRRRFAALGAALNQDSCGAVSDVVHVQHQYFLFGGVAPYRNHAAPFLNAVRRPLVVTVHEIAMPGPADSRLRQLGFTAVNRSNLTHPHIRRWIVHTGQDRERLVALHVPPQRIHVIPIGIPTMAALPDAAAAKKELGLEGRRVVTLFGFLAAKKGHLLALDAAHELPADVVLLFAGDRHPDDRTEYVDRLHAAIRERRMESRARITGYLPAESLPTLVAATDVAIAPFSQTSGSASLALMLAGGRAVVASDIAPHREVAADQPARLALFRSGDASDLATQIRSVLENPKRRTELESSARRFAECHSFLQVARETVEVYRLARSS